MRRATRRNTTIAVLTLAAAAQATVLLVGRDSRHPTTPASQAPRRAGAAARPGVTVLRARRTGTLPAPLQDPATFGLDSGRAFLLGGLDSADTSVAQVVRAGAGSTAVLGSLPAAVHDAAATRIGGAGYLFGGGNLVSSDVIVRVSATGAVSVAGHLPVAASDVGAATVGANAYVVGGYDGTSPLRSIVAWAPGGPARVVGQLPRPLRYAAVASAGGRVIVAGGTDGGQASRAILAFDPATRRVRRIGTLPRAVTHAAAATLGGTVYLIGGRGSGLGSQTGGIVAIDPATGRTRAAGHLPVATSDAGVAALGDRILVAGGRDRLGQVLSSVLALEPTQARAAVDVYAADRPGHLSPVVAGFPQRVYVPNSRSNTVDVIDQHTFRIVEHFSTGALPQHVTPSYDLKTLWVDNDEGNSLTPIDPRTGHPGRPVPVADPYNLYFTTDGRYAIVVAERLHRLDFRDPHTMRLHHSVPVPCAGVDHMDFTADGRYALASCEFSGEMVRIDIAREKVADTLMLRPGAMPQDVKLSPDGRVFYVADMMSNGVWVIDAQRFRKVGFVHTGAGAHGLYASRDSRVLYVSNRGEGSVSLISFRTRGVVKKWRLPGGGSPDMGGVSADGRVLWLSGRYNSVVYAISTLTGKLLARIPVGLGPHGLSVYPQPGRYSLGHTGVFR